MPRQSVLHRSGLWLAGCALLLSVSTAQADALSESIQTEKKIDKNAAVSQGKVDKLADQAGELLAEYRQVIREVENLRIYNTQLEKVVNNQRSDIQSIEDQMSYLEETNRGVVPMMLEMVTVLGQLVEGDVPFLLEERRDRVAKLEELMDSSSVTTSEKYRRVMEAYQIEMEYGRSLSQYEGKLPGADRTVKFLKLGRVVLVYQTLDGEETGWWNPQSRSFETLPEEFRLPVQNGLKIAANQSPPNLINLPIPAPVKAQ